MLFRSPQLKDFGVAPYDGADGASILAALGNNRDSLATSNALRDAGIPGIKYLDQGSRAAGEGTRNYVVFDPAIIEILRKYGLAGMIGGGAAAYGLGSDDSASAAPGNALTPR